MDSENNIIKWYPFEENAKILEVYNERSILENSKLNINLTKIQYNESIPNDKFDYIFTAGVLEYAPIICKGLTPYVDFLNLLKDHLNPNGKAFVAIDNRLGIKYLAGGKSKLYDKCFEGVQSEISNNKPSLLLKSEIEKIIEQSNFKNSKFYYPLGDYNNTNTIFTDSFLPKSNHSKTVYPTNYLANSVIVYSEINVIKQLCNNNDFANFANSFLLELTDVECSNIKFVNYNIFRKDMYKLMLIMDDSGIKKYAETSEATGHIKNIEKYITELKKIGIEVLETVNKGVVESKFCELLELDKYLIKDIENENYTDFYNKIENYYSFLKSVLPETKQNINTVFEAFNVEISEDLKTKLHFIKDGYIDLIFENIFMKDNEYVFYDQEWYYENIPIEFILYRALNNFYTYNEMKLEGKLSKEEVFQHFELNDFVCEFEKIEKCIQAEIIDEKRIKEYRDNNANIHFDISYIIKENKDMKDIIHIKDNQYQELLIKFNEVNTEYVKLLNEYNNSRGWKLIKKLRKITGRK